MENIRQSNNITAIDSFGGYVRIMTGKERNGERPFL